MSSGFKQTLLLKTPAKQGVIAEILGDRRSFYEVQYAPGYFLALLFLKKVSGVLDDNLRLVFGCRYKRAKELVTATCNRVFIRKHDQGRLLGEARVESDLVVSSADAPAEFPSAIGSHNIAIHSISTSISGKTSPATRVVRAGGSLGKKA
jgi:hypothetical protein